MTVLKREDLPERRQVKLTIQVEQDVWHAALAEAYAAVKAVFPVSGEATRENLEATYGADFLYQEGVDATYPQALVDAVNAQDIQLAGTPTLEVETIGPEGYVFTALIDLYPEVKLGQYKGLSAVYPAVELSEEDTQAALNGFLQQHLAEEHPDKAAMGDEVSIDFEGFVDGVAFEGGKGEQYPLVLGSGMFIPGFEEQLAGMAVGEERDVKVTFPTEYTPELAGKDAVFKVVCRGITRRTVPQLTDAMARLLGYDDVSALRRHVMEDALQHKASQAHADFGDALVQQVIDGMEVDIPPAMIENQLDGMLQELENHMAAQGMELAQYLEAAGLTREQLRDHSRAQAENAARYELAMTEVARREGIEISDEELNAQYAQLSQQYGLSEGTLRAQLPPIRMRHDMKLQQARAVIVNTAKQL